MVVRIILELMLFNVYFSVSILNLFYNLIQENQNNKRIEKNKITSSKSDEMSLSSSYWNLHNEGNCG